MNAVVVTEGSRNAPRSPVARYFMPLCRCRRLLAFHRFGDARALSIAIPTASCYAPRESNLISHTRILIVTLLQVIATTKQVMTAQCINAQVSTSLDRRSRLDAEPLANEYSPSKLLTIAMQRRRELLEQPTPDYRRQLLNKALVQCLFKLVGECRRSSDRRSPSSRRRASRRRSQLAAAQKRKLQRAEQHESSPKRMRADNVESTDCEQRQGAMALSQFSSTSATGMTAETYNSVEYEQLNTQVCLQFVKIVHYSSCNCSLTTALATQPTGHQNLTVRQ